MNAIRAIYPYKDSGLWVFDDERVGLDKEPFIAGADTLIDPALFKYFETAPKELFAKFEPRTT